MDATKDETQADAGEPIGTGWRTASWMAFALTLVIASQAMTTTSRDMVHAAVLAAGALLMLLIAGLGLMFAIFGAAASAQAGDRRVVVMLPLWANAALLLWLVVMIFGP